MLLQPLPTFRAAVRLTVPGADKPAEITITWRHKTRAALGAWLAKPAELLKAGTTLSDADYLDEVISAWSGIQDERGAEVPYSPEHLAALLDAYPAAPLELRDAYLKALTESRLGN